MEEQPPPLSPQEMEATHSAQYAESGQPQTVKIFGILHIILGSYGVFAIILAIIAMFGVNPFSALMPKTPAASAQMEQQAALQADMLPITIVSTVIAAATTAFILTAGVLFLKRRRNGLKWSNRYSWTSLAGKAYGTAVTFLYTSLMMKKPCPGWRAPWRTWCSVRWFFESCSPASIRSSPLSCSTVRERRLGSTRRRNDTRITPRASARCARR